MLYWAYALQKLKSALVLIKYTLHKEKYFLIQLCWKNTSVKKKSWIFTQQEYQWDCILHIIISFELFHSFSCEHGHAACGRISKLEDCWLRDKLKRGRKCSRQQTSAAHSAHSCAKPVATAGRRWHRKDDTRSSAPFNSGALCVWYIEGMAVGRHELRFSECKCQWLISKVALTADNSRSLQNIHPLIAKVCPSFTASDKKRFGNS